MKTLKTAILVLSAISISAHAWSLLDSKYETKRPELKKYLDFAKKDDRCDFVVAIVPRSSASKALKGIYEQYSSILRCVGDVVFNEGTINEVNGCAAFYLSPATKRMSSFLPPEKGGNYNIVKNKKCKDAFDELTKMQTSGMVRMTVGETLSGRDGFGGTPLFGGYGADYESESFLIYSVNEKWTKWYFNEKKETEKKQKEAYKKSKSSSSLNTYANGETIKEPVTDEEFPK